MAFEVVDRQQRLVVRQGDSLASQQADHNPADQARTGRGGDAIQLRIVEPGSLHGRSYEPIQVLDMRPRRDFGHHPFIGRVIGDLAQHQVRQYFRPLLAEAHDRGRGFIAAGFNAKDGKRLHQERAFGAFPAAAPAGKCFGMTVLFRIGARGSKLSMAQTEQTCAAFARHMGLEAGALEIVPIVTSGDRIQDRTLIEAGGKGLFTKELDEALRDGRVDFAVHSLKDLPTALPEDIALACVPEREDPRDAFVSPHAVSLADLDAGARVGTASLRRQAQTLYARPDLGVVIMRGNVDTRLKKLDSGEAEATYLALAGLKRLGLESRATSLVDPTETPPAACQGALAITARADDARVRDAPASFENSAARLEIEAERAFLAGLDGSCRTPIAALARTQGDEFHFVGEALTPDGTARWRRAGMIRLGDTALSDVRTLGATFAREIRHEAGDALTVRDA